MTASLTQSGGECVLVRLRDVSRRGVSVVRVGSLPITPEDTVTFEVFDFESHPEPLLSIKATIRWIEATRHFSYAGLHFLDGPLAPGSVLDEYLDRSLRLPRHQPH